MTARQGKSGKKVILVTGANGRLGKEAIKTLVNSGATVRALIQKKEYLLELPQGTVPYIGDIRNHEVLKEACDGADMVYHFAAIVSQYRTSGSEIIKVNAHGTRALLDACENGGVGHFIFTSSIDVYGRVRRELLNEDSRLRPSDMYGHSKMLAEEEIETYGNSVPYTIFRMAAIYGSGFEKSFFKVFRIIKNGKVRIIGDGNNFISLIHLKDVVQALLLAKDKSISRNKIYNLSDGKKYTQEYLYDFAADLLGAPKPSKHISEVFAAVLAKVYGIDTDELRFITSNRIIDTAKIRHDLGFKPKVDITKGGAELVKMFKQKNRVLW